MRLWHLICPSSPACWLYCFYSLVHSVLLDYLNECNDEDRTEMITAFAPFIPSLASTKDGVRSSMICFWNSIVKDRRVSIALAFQQRHCFSIKYFVGHREKSQRTFDKIVCSRTRTCFDSGNNQFHGWYEGVEEGGIWHYIQPNRVHCIERMGKKG